MDKLRYNYGQELKASWFLPLRLAIFLVIVGVMIITQEMMKGYYTHFLIYSLLTLTLLFSLAFRLPGKYPRFSRLLILLQILSEILVESAVINASGSITSPFTALFLLTIVSAALAYQLIGTLITATVASGSFIIVSLTDGGLILSRNWNIEALKVIYSSSDEQFYTIFVYVCIFYLVAFVAGYLSQKIKSKERELRAASESLARVRLETDEILKHLHSGLITVDHFGRILYFNRAAEKISGYLEKDIKGKNCLEAFADRMPELSEKIFSVIKSNQHEQRSEVNMVDKDGNVKPIGISTSVLEDEHAGVRGVVGIFQDLTESKKLEEKMRNADRLAAVGELSASIAHEIRNPLASISGSVEILQQELNPEGENCRLMDLIVKEASRLSNILNDFLVYARVQKPNFSKVEVNRVVSDIFEIAKKHPAYNKSIRLNLDGDDTTVYVKGDDDHIRQVLLNLVVNAMEALDQDGGRVSVTVSSNYPQHSDQVLITVNDDGKGIEEKDPEKVFQPFFSTKKEGTGLGLAIVKRLVENMGGRVFVESTPHGGTDFSFTLIKYFEGMPVSSTDSEIVRMIESEVRE